MTKRAVTKPLPRTGSILVLQGNFKYGWEDQSAYEDTVDGRDLAEEGLLSWRRNDPLSRYRIVRRCIDLITREPVRRKAPKPNGRRLKRTKRACSARGKALKRTGSPVAASRLAKLCPTHDRRKPNGAKRFAVLEPVGNGRGVVRSLHRSRILAEQQVESERRAMLRRPGNASAWLSRVITTAAPSVRLRDNIAY